MVLASSITLDEAIALRGPLVLSSTVEMPASREPAKFLALDEEGGLWVQPMRESDRVARRWMELRVPLLGHLFDRNGRYTFATQLVRRRKDYWLTDRVAIEAWLLEAPSEIKTIQERMVPRYHLSDTRMGIQGKVMVIQRKQTAQVSEVPATMLDLGMGGVSFVFPMLPHLLQAPPRTIPYQPVIQFGMQKVALNGLLIYANAISVRSMRIGIEFLPASRQPPETFEKLQSLLTQFDGQTLWARPRNVVDDPSAAATRITSNSDEGSRELARELETWLRVPPPAGSGD